jgi:hypothetical protein
MNLQRHLILIACCLIAGCSDYGTDPDAVRTGQISIEIYQVGQTNRYRHYFAYGDVFYGPQPPPSQFRPDTIVYQPDTLITEIVARTSSGFEMIEYYSPGSSVLKASGKEADTLGILHTTVRIENGGVTFDGESRLVNAFLQSRIFPISLPLAPIESPVTEFKSWRASIYPNREQYVQGCVREYAQLGRLYYWLNVIIDTTMGNGFGRTIVYSSKQGVVRVLYESQGSPIEGWDLM